MHKDKNLNGTASSDISDTDSKSSGPGLGSRIAPAVALLMLGDSAFAVDEDDNLDFAPVPAPSVLALLAVGAVAGGVARYVHKKRRKK